MTSNLDEVQAEVRRLTIQITQSEQTLSENKDTIREGKQKIAAFQKEISTLTSDIQVYVLPLPSPHELLRGPQAEHIGPWTCFVDGSLPSHLLSKKKKKLFSVLRFLKLISVFSNTINKKSINDQKAAAEQKKKDLTKEHEALLPVLETTAKAKVQAEAMGKGLEQSIQSTTIELENEYSRSAALKIQGGQLSVQLDQVTKTLEEEVKVQYHLTSPSPPLHASGPASIPSCVTSVLTWFFSPYWGRVTHS